MKKLISKGFLFLIILVVADYVAGTVMGKMYFSIETGTSGARINHLLHNKYDAYIMGASSVKHGCIPEIIEAEIGMSVRNAGENGVNVLYNYTLLQLILQHHKPKLIIWDVSNADFYYSQMNSKTELIVAYHEIESIRTLLYKIDPINKVALFSKIYPYNQKLLAILISYFRDKKHNGSEYSGYDPLYGSLDPESISDPDLLFEQAVKENAKKRNSELDPRSKLIREYFYKFINECKTNDIKLVAVYAPRAPISKGFSSIPLIAPRIVKELQQHSIPLHIILSGDYPQLSVVEKFKDVSHVNDVGAREYSKIIAHYIRKDMKLSD